MLIFQPVANLKWFMTFNTHDVMYVSVQMCTVIWVHLRLSLELTFFRYGRWWFACGPVRSDRSTAQPLSIHVTNGSLGILKYVTRIDSIHMSFKYISPDQLLLESLLLGDLRSVRKLSRLGGLRTWSQIDQRNKSG